MPLPRTVDELLAHVNTGASVKYLFFWGHRPSKDGSATKSCLSQWFEAPFTVDGVQYATAEHFMMAEKARLFGDTDTLDRILKAANPGAVKAFGREVRGFDEQVWVEARSRIVVRANLVKFLQNQSLRSFLLNTGDRILVEASPVDRLWGIGLAHDDPTAQDPNLWKGLNLLGFALMEVREQLQENCV